MDRTYADLEFPAKGQAKTGTEAAVVLSTQDRLQPQQPVAERAPTIITVIQEAIRSNADINTVTKLFEIRERELAREAEQRFEAAMSRFKADPPTIIKNKHVRYPTKAGGMVDYFHATLDHICDEVIPALSIVGITHKWRISQKDDLITVTCVLKGFGHSEETSMFGLPDTSGDKSPLKAASSTVTTLQRYTLLSGLGLAAAPDDETEKNGSGKTNGRPFMSAEDLQKAVDAIKASKNMADLRLTFKAYFEKAQELNDRKAMDAIGLAKDMKKSDFGG